MGEMEAGGGRLVLGVMFLGAGFGAAINAVMRTHVGHLINVGTLIRRDPEDLFRQPNDLGVSPAEAWMALLVDLRRLPVLAAPQDPRI